MFWNRHKDREAALPTADVRKLIADLQLPQIVLALFDETCSDEKVMRLLGSQYQKPYSLFDQPLSQVIEHYKVDRYIPFLAIWQSVILAYDTINKGFVRYSLEYFCEESFMLLTWDGLMLKEVIGWWELEWPDEDMLYMGHLFGINNMERLIKEIALHNATAMSYEDHRKWEYDLLYTIGGLVE